MEFLKKALLVLNGIFLVFILFESSFKEGVSKVEQPPSYSQHPVKLSEQILEQSPQVSGGFQSSSNE